MRHTADDITPLRSETAWFAEAMEIQLCANDHKTGWSRMSLKTLLHRLRQETAELERAIEMNAPAHVIIAEAADVANFAMMIADNSAQQRAEAEDLASQEIP